MNKRTIAEIAAGLALATDESAPFVKEAESDGRKGVQELVRKWKKARDVEKLHKNKHETMTFYEKKARANGFELIAGTDEAGRGPLAGPVTAAAVILPENFYLPGLDDSKKLSSAKRNEYERIIKEKAVAFNVNFISAEEIDAINILQASIKAMKAAVAGLSAMPDYLLVDAVKLDMPFPSEPIIKGDAKSISIAAASILAKNARDRFMAGLAKQHPEYGFEKNMGYGTKDHLAAIEKYGITPFHRKSFEPIKTIAVNQLELDF